MAFDASLVTVTPTYALSDLASAFSGAGCNIEVVLIDTEAHKALDVFYVTYQGAKLTESKCAELAEKLLGACQG